MLFAKAKYMSTLDSCTMNYVSVPSKETLLPEMVKSTPVCRMAVPQVSPSIPTHAEAAKVPEPLPEGLDGVGTTNVAVTDL